jgi:hypothetical protein
LAEHATQLNPQFNSAIKAAGAAIRLGGGSAGGSYGLLMGQIQKQAATLAYIDCFWLFGVAFTILVPFVFFMKRVAPGTGRGGGH